MSALPPKNPFDKLVDLTRSAIYWRNDMHQHLLCNVLPYLGTSAQETIRDLLHDLDEEDDISPNLAVFIDTGIAEIREAITAGTSTKRVLIPEELLIGCKEAYDTETVLSPEAEALTAALPRLEAFYNATRQAVDYAEAIRLSMRMLDVD